MTGRLDDYDHALERAALHAREWLGSVHGRKVRPSVTADELAAGFAKPLQDGPTDPAQVVDELAELAEPGLMAMGSGKFFGWVIGGTLPAALASDWLVSTWDQNTGMRFATPATVAAEEAAAGWLLDLLGLPERSAVGFVTGGTMANFTGLAAGRHQVLAGVGWDVSRQGLTGGPKVHVLVGAERHDTVDLTLRYLGLGEPASVAADEQGRIRTDALADALSALEPGTPTIVALQAGNVHSGAFDPMREAIDIAHRHGAWVHVDGAFGLFAGASPRLRHLLDGYEAADSWATDAHKTLNVPYDCGIAIVKDQVPLRTALGVHASYLIHADDALGDPIEKVPELSRRARGVPVWAALRSLGRDGVAALVDGMCDNARALAEGIGALDGAEILNDVVYTQVCASFGADARTAAVTEALLDEGVAWMSGSRWHDRAVLRVSVSNWSTDDADVAESLAAVRCAVAAAG